MRQIYTKWGPFLVANINGIPFLHWSTLSVCACVCVVYFTTLLVLNPLYSRLVCKKWKGYASRRSWRKLGIMPKFTEENKKNLRIACVPTGHLQPTTPQQYCYRLHAPQWQPHSSISKPTSLSFMCTEMAAFNHGVLSETFGQRRKNDRQDKTVTVFSNCWVYLNNIYVRSFL